MVADVLRTELLTIFLMQINYKSYDIKIQNPPKYCNLNKVNFDEKIPGIGIYHNVSPKHLSAYCNEFGYRYNSRQVKDVIRFEDAIKNVNGKRLTYANLIS